MEFFDALKHRRTRYALNADISVSEGRIEELVGTCLTEAPSAFNSQSSRAIVLFGEKHAQLWDIVLEALRKVAPAEGFEATEQKIAGFAAGAATVLFFEDESVVRGLQEAFPPYADNFPKWSQQSSGMAQFAVWTALSAEGLGVNVQHYNPLIDEEVARAFDVPENWTLISQMVVGNPVAEPDALEKMAVADRVLVRR